MTYPVGFTARAQRQILRALSWWARHRDKAPDALEDDLSNAFAFIAENPQAGKFMGRQRRGVVRRIELDRSRYYLYYRININGDIDVLQLWHSSRRPPKR